MSVKHETETATAVAERTITEQLQNFENETGLRAADMGEPPADVVADLAELEGETPEQVLDEIHQYQDAENAAEDEDEDL